MKPPKRQTNYERVPVYDEWINGKIEDIEYEMERKTMWEGKEKVGPHVRFKFILEGCKFPKKTPWMSFNYSEKANLYKKFITALVADAAPDLDFDLDALKGLDVKVMFTQNGEYDNIEMVRPLKNKVPKGTTVDEAPEQVEDQATF
jgi:hypothetical protein